MSQRPGGLTALAVINFIFGGFFSLAAVGMAIFSGKGTISDGVDTYEIPADETSLLRLILLLISAGLLIVSGLGYLWQSKKFGFLFGSLYAVVSIASSIVVIMNTEFLISNLIGFIYPIVTLAMLHIVFKDDFINP